MDRRHALSSQLRELVPTGGQAGRHRSPGSVLAGDTWCFTPPCRVAWVFAFKFGPSAACHTTDTGEESVEGESLFCEELDRVLRDRATAVPTKTLPRGGSG